MFEEMRGSVGFVGFGTRASVDPDTDCSGLRMRLRLRGNGEAIRKRGHLGERASVAESRIGPEWEWSLFDVYILANSGGEFFCQGTYGERACGGSEGTAEEGSGNHLQTIQSEPFQKRFLRYSSRKDTVTPFAQNPGLAANSHPPSCDLPRPFRCDHSGSRFRLARNRYKSAWDVDWLPTMNGALGIAKNLWLAEGLPAEFLKHLKLSGNPDTAINSSFKIGALAQVGSYSASLACSSGLNEP